MMPRMNEVSGPGIVDGFMAKESTRGTIVKTIRDLVMKNGFDGIDLDFEKFAFTDPI